MQSEFGKGLAICLVKFAEHYERWSRDRVREEEMAVKTGRTDLFNERHSVESFFNAASDHLYEIEVPATWKKKKIARKVRELQDFALMICLLYTSPSPRDRTRSRMPSSA